MVSFTALVPHPSLQVESSLQTFLEHFSYLIFFISVFRFVNEKFERMLCDGDFMAAASSPTNCGAGTGSIIGTVGRSENIKGKQNDHFGLNWKRRKYFILQLINKKEFYM